MLALILGLLQFGLSEEPEIVALIQRVNATGQLTDADIAVIDKNLSDEKARAALAQAAVEAQQ